MPLFYTEIDNFSIHYVIETSRARAQQGEGHHRDGRAGQCWEGTEGSSSRAGWEAGDTLGTLSIPYRPQGQPDGLEQGVVLQGGSCPSFTSLTEHPVP